MSINRALEASDWDLSSADVQLEMNTARGRVDYLLRGPRGDVLCVIEAKRKDVDPRSAQEQARGYAQNVRAPFVILSNGEDHWFWNYERVSDAGLTKIERLPSQRDLERLRLRNMQPPRSLQSEVVGPEYLSRTRSGLTLRAYQLAALEAVAALFDHRQQRKFLLEMATGTGKTLLCAALIRRFLMTRNAERVLFIVDRVELANQAMEDFENVLTEYNPVIYKTARRTGELVGSSVVVATIQSLMAGRRFREEFTPFYFDLVINDEAHRSIYGDSREAVQFFQATRLGLTATPRAYLANIDLESLAISDPKSLEARELRDTYQYFGCEPGQPTFRYDLVQAVQDPDGPFLCLPKIVDCRSDITTRALQEAGWVVDIDERQTSFKIQDLERKVFTPHRNRVMCETLLQEAQREPTGLVGRTIVFAVNQAHAFSLTAILNDIRPGIAIAITSQVPDASLLAKEFRDGLRPERIAISVNMLSTGYNCPEILNIALMRPVFSPTEYIQIKGRGTRRFTFTIADTDYEKKTFFLIDFCAVAEYFEEQYDYSAPLKIVASGRSTLRTGASSASAEDSSDTDVAHLLQSRDIPVWEGSDRIVSHEVRIVGPGGEKVDLMTFRGSFERDVRDFAENYPSLSFAVELEDDDAIEDILEQEFYHRPEMYYSADKLIKSYGIPAPSSVFVYNALGRKPLPSQDEILNDTVSSIAARFNLRYSEQKWLAATAELIVDDPTALSEFLGSRYGVLFDRGQFQALGGIRALADFTEREQAFEALRQSSIVRCVVLISTEAA